MKTLLAILIAFLFSVSNTLGERTPVTFVGAFHLPSTGDIVFSVHSLRFMKEGEIEKIFTNQMSVYVKVNDVKYPINIHRQSFSGSVTKWENIIDEYVIRNYKSLGDVREIPGLRNAKTIVFGLNYRINDQKIIFEESVPIKLITSTSEKVEK